MQWSDISTRSRRRTLRQFALIWIVFFAGLAVYQQACSRPAARGGVLAVLALDGRPRRAVVAPWPCDTSS